MKYYLYQIRNKTNNYIYIGVHCSNKIRDRYMGSGIAIKEAIKKEGIENFEKTILEFFENKDKMLEREREIVNEDFIKRNDTYNIILGGGFNTSGTVTVRDKQGISFQVNKDDIRYLSGELVHNCKGLVTVKDKDGNILSASINDPRYLTGELESINKNKITVKDSLGTTFMVDKNDPRYISGELVHHRTGTSMPKEHVEKLKKINSEKQTGNGNSQYGTIWIHNINLKKSIKIKKIKLKEYLSTGWIKGRKIIFNNDL